MNHNAEHSKHVTVLLAGGLIAPAGMKLISSVAEKYNLTLYATTMQNFSEIDLRFEITTHICHSSCRKHDCR